MAVGLVSFAQLKIDIKQGATLDAGCFTSQTLVQSLTPHTESVHKF